MSVISELEQVQDDQFTLTMAALIRLTMLAIDAVCVSGRKVFNRTGLKGGRGRVTSTARQAVDCGDGR